MRTSTLFTCIGLCIAAVSVISLYMISAEYQRHAVNELAAKVTDVTERLEHELGYGGLIHNFKNYVLRPDEPRYYEHAVQNAAKATELIRELETIAQPPIHGVPLPETQRMVTEYSGQLQVVREMASNGATAREIDATVRFDDSPSLIELKTIVQSLNASCRAEAERLERRTRMLMLLNVILGIGAATTLATVSIGQHVRDLQTQVVYIRLLGESGGIWNWNRQTDHVQYAPKFRQLLGYDRNDRHAFPETFQAFRERIHPDDSDEFFDQLNAQQRTREPFTVEFRMLHRDGGHFWFRTHAHTLFDSHGTPIRTAGTIFNIEDKKKSENELQESNRELQRFAFAASHDLQEPLRAIAGFSQLLQQRHADSLNAKGHTYLQHIIDGATRMKDLIDDILMLSRVGQSELEITQVDLQDCVATALQNLSQLTLETSPEITVSELGMVHGHEGFLVELFQNLISNAIKFSKPNEPAKITITSEVRGSRKTIIVADQ
ncbi:MAG: PAS domain-containing protein, partial [Rhodopirellula sp. JB055]|uniref:sensor histidine kinase n=1 Tax=Rhodopirellula sp. JB055 TaxID=3342846 RepID=UPI00370A1CD6